MIAHPLAPVSGAVSAAAPPESADLAPAAAAAGGPPTIAELIAAGYPGALVMPGTTPLAAPGGTAPTIAELLAGGYPGALVAPGVLSSPAATAPSLAGGLPAGFQWELEPPGVLQGIGQPLNPVPVAAAPPPMAAPVAPVLPPAAPVPPMVAPQPPGDPVPPGVPPANGRPVAENDFYALKHGATLTISAADGLRANDMDPDGDLLTYSLVDDPFGRITRYGDLTLNPDGSFTYVARADASGTEQLQIKVSDGRDNTWSLLTIVVGNAQPKANDDSYEVSPGRTNYIGAFESNGVLANDTDPDDDKLSAFLLDGELIEGQDRLTTEKGLVIMSKSGGFSYTPHAGVFNDTDTFRYLAEDGAGGVSVATVTVRIVNKAPVAVHDQYAGSHDKPLTVGAAAGLLANDSDPEGGKLTVENAGVAHRTAKDGTVTYTADGSFTYTPPKDFIGTDSFLYTVSDQWGALGLAGVTIKVGNADPVVKSFSFDLPHDKVVSIDAASGLLQGATDADGDKLKAIAHDKATAHGHVWIFESGAFIYKPDAGFVGKDAFGFAAVDGFGGIGLGSITINVTNAAPAAKNDTYAVNAGGTLQTSVFTGLLSNDGIWKDGAFRDADGDALSVATTGLHRPTAHGSVKIADDGSFSYTPDKGFVGLDYFDYNARDGFGGFGSATVVIRVDNNPPQPQNDVYDMLPGTTGVLMPDWAGVLRNDGVFENGTVRDQDGHALTVTAVRNLPTAHGTVTINADGSFHYSANGTPVNDSFTYQVNDGHGGTASATAIIRAPGGGQVSVVPDAPPAFPVAVLPPADAGSSGGTPSSGAGTGASGGGPVFGIPIPGEGDRGAVPPTGTADGGAPGQPGASAGDGVAGGPSDGGPPQGGPADGGIVPVDGLPGLGGFLPGFGGVLPPLAGIGLVPVGGDAGIILLPGSGRGTDDDPPGDALTPTAPPADDRIVVEPQETVDALHRFDHLATDLIFA